MPTPQRHATLRPYYTLLRSARPALQLHIRVSLKIADRWSSHTSSARRHFTLYCPPFSADQAPIFLHYLCHAKILEDGWVMPVSAVEAFSSRAFEFQKRAPIIARLERMTPADKYTLLWGWFNRSMDSFFDMYAWRLVLQTFGPTPLLAFTEKIASESPARVIRYFRSLYDMTKFKYDAYVTSIDWFVLFPLLCAPVDAQRSKKLLLLRKRLFHRKEFLSSNIPDVGQRFAHVDAFYDRLLQRYPDYRALLVNASELKKCYQMYFNLVWRDAGITARIVRFQ